MAELIIIDETNFKDHFHPIIDGERKGMGCIVRELHQFPVGSFSGIQPFPDYLIYPREEWEEKLSLLKTDKAQPKDVRESGCHGDIIPARDQGNRGYCWAYSGTSAMLLARAIAGMPYADLSAYAVACKIKNFRDEGGFGAQGVQFMHDHGVPTSAFWPQQSMDRACDNVKTWANAGKHKYVRWYDLDPSSPKYLDQYVSAKLRRMPTVNDYSWWSHSVCGEALESIDFTKDLSKLTWNDLVDWILNSWGQNWSEHGAGMIKGAHTKPCSCIAASIVTPSED